jgi:hypothetical protein
MKRGYRRTRYKRPAKSGRLVPRTAEEFFALPEQLQDRWIRVANAISRVRADRVSLARASREFGLDPRTAMRLGRSGLRKRANGRYAARPSDRLLRVLVIPTGEGLREIALRDSRQASEVAEYSNGVQRYLQTGDSSALREFTGKYVTDAKGEKVLLLTDLEELDRLGNAGVLSFESLYARAAA